MSNTSNPAEIYPNTTWELLATDKYLKTTTGTPLVTGGSNSFKIAKENLPAEKLQIDSFQLGKGTQEIAGKITSLVRSPYEQFSASGAFSKISEGKSGYGVAESGYGSFDFKASRSWTGMSTSASPSTQNLGSGTPLTINPEHITVRAWKRTK